jgi:hypothetical protein
MNAELLAAIAHGVDRIAEATEAVAHRLGEMALQLEGDGLTLSLDAVGDAIGHAGRLVAGEVGALRRAKSKPAKRATRATRAKGATR